MFIRLQQEMSKQLDRMLALGSLLYSEIDREKVWDVYLNAFPVDQRQEHNCNHCKSFLRQYAGICIIKDGRKETIWDNLVVEDEYKAAIKALKDYTKSLPITDVFVSDTFQLGTVANHDMQRNVEWRHFTLRVPQVYVKGVRDIDSFKADQRTKVQMIVSSMTQISKNAAETVLELINQGSIYRGNEFKSAITEFLSYVDKFKDNPIETAWENYKNIPSNVAYIKNSAIGTLLLNVSEGMDLDVAVSKYETIVAPANYKRPSAIVTPKMLENAKQYLIDAGLLESLNRRYAVDTDISTENVIFTATKSNAAKDVFETAVTESVVNPSRFNKVAELSIEDFIKNVVPTASEIEILLENRLTSNLVTLLTSQQADVPSLFKWNNNFSWAYTGDMTDSPIKERVKSLGGNIDAVVRFSIQWNDEDTPGIVDFDAHAYEPNKVEIAFNSNYIDRAGNRRTSLSGNLDIDMVNPEEIGIENITWNDKSKMIPGEYKLWVRNYNSRRNKGFKAEVEIEGVIYNFQVGGNVSSDTTVAVVTLATDGTFSIKSNLHMSDKVSSKSIWNVKTNTFVPVSKIMLSPNYWSGNAVGNKHYIFALKDCISNEKTRPIYNEFLKSEFDVHRKAFELVGSKLTLEPNEHQLSGVGFSDTKRNSMLVNVKGKTNRVINVKF